MNTEMEQTSDSASSSKDTASSQQSLPSSYDSGWNDPPEWALSSQRSSSGAYTKKFLNKRVAFPLSPQASPSEKANSTSSPFNMPPIQSPLKITTAPHKPLVTPIDRDSTVELSAIDLDKSGVLTEILANLESVITEQEMENSKREEICRRLDSMKSDWLENKLNDTIQKSILDITKALLRKDVEQADKIHIALMMHHATVCRMWMPAIRHIILELKKKCENYDILESENSQSLLLSVNEQKNKSIE